MKKIHALVLAFAIFPLGFASGYFTDIPDSPEGIQFFKGSWNDAVAKAKAEHKPIFLDVYATWCGPCRVLKKRTFPDKGVGQYFNENYVNVSINGETPEGTLIMEKYQLHAYPSLLIINLEEEPIAIELGYHPAEWLLSFGKSNIQRARR